MTLNPTAWTAALQKNGRLQQLGTLEARTALEAKREARRLFAIPRADVRFLVVDRARGPSAPPATQFLGMNVVADASLPAGMARLVAPHGSSVELVGLGVPAREYVGRIVLELELAAPDLKTANAKAHEIAEGLARGRDELCLLAVSLELAQ